MFHSDAPCAADRVSALLRRKIIQASATTRRVKLCRAKIPLNKVILRKQERRARRTLNAFVGDSID
jgi:hypothetical protein